MWASRPVVMQILYLSTTTKKNSKHFICNFCKYMYVVYMSFNSYCSISVKNMFHVKENTQFQLYNE